MIIVQAYNICFGKEECEEDGIPTKDLYAMKTDNISLYNAVNISLCNLERRSDTKIQRHSWNRQVQEYLTIMISDIMKQSNSFPSKCTNPSFFVPPVHSYAVGTLSPCYVL